MRRPLLLLADDLHVLRGFPRFAINVYRMGDVLVDSGSRHDARRILRQLEHLGVTAHALTHAHPDHQGSSHVICERLGIPLWCGERDVRKAETADFSDQPRRPVTRLTERLFKGPGHPVARALREGDEVSGFAVLEVPGHSPGHVAFWRESDRALIAGDVMWGMKPFALPLQIGPHEPPEALTPDVPANRDAIRRLAALEPELVCFGHGPPLRDPRGLSRFAASLPSG